jgi:peptidoglycan/xylan/chitin deacetylase (PgdA/CDA1 family)
MSLVEYTQCRTQRNSLSIRGLLRHYLLSVLASYYQAVGRVPQVLRRNRVQFLYLHHINDDEKDAFRNLLRTLAQEHCFISYTAATAMITDGNIDQPYITFSFDDGFKSCLQAAKIMEEFGAKACFFICPSIVGETNPIKISEFCSQRLRTTPSEFLSWDDIGSLIEAGHEIGGHTLTHPNLASLSTSEVRTEVAESYEILRKRVGEIEHFAWPLGRFSHFSPIAAQIVNDTGYATCASAERGCHIAAIGADIRELCIRRDHIIAHWPLEHILYFLAKSSLKSHVENNRWPVSWRCYNGTNV